MSAPAIALRSSHPDAVVTPAPEVRAPSLHAPDNVVAFVRPERRADGISETKVAVAASERCAPAPAGERGTARRAGLILASLIVHGGLLALLAPAPRALVGGEQPAMTVEIVLGEPTPAAPDVAAEEAPREPMTDPAPTSEDRVADEPPPQATLPPPDEAPAPQPTAQTEQPPEPPTNAETATEQTNPPAAEASPAVAAETNATPPEAMTLPPTDEPPPSPQAEPPPEPPPSSEAATDRTNPPPPAPSAMPEPPAGPVPPARTEPATVAPRTSVARPPRPPVREAAPQRRGAHPGAPAQRMAVVAPAKQSDVGGAPRADPNYYGRVAAHLARYKQFPAEARAGRSQGSAAVTFTIDAAGRVTAVRLVRATGVESLDREAQAMTRRASPFPPPPTGQAMTFTVPVNFVMR